VAKKFFTLLIFSIAVVFLGGCSPVGGLLLGDDETLDSIRVVPNRFVYSYPYDPFMPDDPDEGIQVFGIFGGTAMPIDIKDKDVKITISEHSALPTEVPIVLTPSEKENGLELRLKPGVKNVVISYKGKEDFYRISLGETDTGDEGNGNGSGSGIKWEWPDD